MTNLLPVHPPPRWPRGGAERGRKASPTAGVGRQAEREADERPRPPEGRGWEEAGRDRDEEKEGIQLQSVRVKV